jgi:two-component system response regulator YesN
MCQIRILPKLGVSIMYKLIIVDDEQAILNGLKNVIDWNSLGFEIAGTYTNGEQALQEVLQNPPDAILTDIKMPVKDGISFIKDVREAGFNNIKVVYLSGYDDFKYAQASTRLGAVDYILKPSNPKDIINIFSKIRNALDQERKIQQIQYKNKKIMYSSLSFIRAKLFCDMVKGDISSYQEFLQQYFKYLPEKTWDVFHVVSFTTDYLVSQELTNRSFAHDQVIM